jgi:hypothetical protein
VPPPADAGADAVRPCTVHAEGTGAGRQVVVTAGPFAVVVPAVFIGIGATPASAPP